MTRPYRIIGKPKIKTIVPVAVLELSADVERLESMIRTIRRVNAENIAANRTAGAARLIETTRALKEMQRIASGKIQDYWRNEDN